MKIKNNPVLLITTQMLIKITVRLLFISTEMAITKKDKKQKVLVLMWRNWNPCGTDVEKLESHSCWWDCKNRACILENSLAVLPKVKYCITI